MQENGRHTTAIHLWNAFGMADLVIAIALGVTSAANSPLGIFRDGAGSDAMQHLPWSFVPTVLVPIYMILHAIIWVRLHRPAFAYSLAPALEHPREAVGAAIEHGPPAAGTGRVDVGRRVVDEQDRLRHRYAHARLGGGEEHAIGFAHAQRRRIDDLVEMRAEARLVAQIGDAMVFLVGGGEAAAARALPPGCRPGPTRRDR